MKLNSFYLNWGTARALVVALAVLAMTGVAIKSYSYTIEMDYTGPGSEAESLDRASRDRDNERSFDRYHNEGSTSERDREGAEEYERDHGA